MSETALQRLVDMIAYLAMTHNTSAMEHFEGSDTKVYKKSIMNPANYAVLRGKQPKTVAGETANGFCIRCF